MSILLIDLENLQSGSCRINGALSVSDLDLEKESDFHFSGPLQLEARISTTDKLTFYVSGIVLFQAVGECRRCLKEVQLKESITINGVFAFPVALEKMNLTEEERENEGIFSLEYGAKTIDLTSLIREFILLDYPLYLQCSEDCKGLCPYCGADLNREQCICQKSFIDPRWAKLLEKNEKK
jgi:uncharacterized protein